MNSLYKTIVIGGFTLFGAIPLKAQEEANLDSSYANGYYMKREAYFAKLPVQKDAIVFLGNSITEVGDWQEVTGLKRVINRGISGDNTYGVLNRLDAILAQKPKKIFLTIGVNDIKRGTPLETITQNHERIIKKIISVSPKTKLYVQSVLPVHEPMLANIYSKIRNEKIKTVNISLRQLAEKYKVEYINLHNELFLDEQAQLKKELSTDGLHLQPLAYIVWANYLKSKKYLKY